MVEQCLETVEILKEKGMDVALVNLHTIKPLDSALIRAYAAKCGKVFTVEEHSVIGGLGDAVAAELVGSGAFTFQQDRHSGHLRSERQARRPPARVQSSTALSSPSRSSKQSKNSS